MTASDIFVMLREIRDVIIGRWILNVYQLNGTLLFKLSHDSPNKIWLLIEPGKRMHLTALTYEKESKLRAFCKTLRKHLRDHKIAALDQHDFDRVVYLRAGPPEKQFTLVIELFGGGNAILLDPKNRIVTAMTYRRMRDRDIIRGVPFQFPPLRASNPLTISQKAFSSLIQNSKQDIVRTLVKELNMSGATAEEIIHSSGIDTTTLTSDLTRKQNEKLYKGMMKHFEILATGQLYPHIILDEKTEPIRALPIRSTIIADNQVKTFLTFNEALDSFYSTRREEQAIDKIDDEYQRELIKFQKLMEKQQQHLETMKTRATQSRSAANAIYQQLPLVEELISTVRDARQQDVSWKDIQKRLDLGKTKKITAAMIVDRLDPHSGRIHITLNDHSIALDIRLSATENANQMFQRSKQLEKKVEGANIAIDDTKRKLTQLQEKHDEALIRTEIDSVVYRRKKKWYEKFRWFRTSKDLLVLGGRDAGSNQQLIRKHLEETDLFFHADIAGAPVVLVKTKGQEISAEELEEVAIFAVSYSRAWKAGRSSCDAYWVESKQVSLSAPSGEYLPKGSVMVRGDRNYLRNMPVRLAIGLDTENGFPFLVAGPKSAIQQLTEIWITLVPGSVKISDIAKQIRKQFANRAPVELKQKILGLSIDEIIALLPPGPADFEA